MESTLFLASLWGPALFALGLGFFLSPKFYKKIYQDIEKEPFALLIFGLSGIAAGILHVQYHNTWESLSEVLVSLLGWGLLVKAAIFAIKPDIADMGGNWAVATKMLPGAGIVMIALGGYLSWLAYFA